MEPAANPDFRPLVAAYLERIADRVTALTLEIADLRGALERGNLELEHYQSYRLAVTLMRVDEAAAGLVRDVAKREEAREELPGQLPAFDLEE